MSMPNCSPYSHSFFFVVSLLFFLKSHELEHAIGNVCHTHCLGREDFITTVLNMKTTTTTTTKTQSGVVLTIVVLFSPLHSASLQPLGTVFAVVSCGGWNRFI